MSLLATLPTVPTKRATKPEQLTALLYGRPGVGKTYTASHAENSLLLATERGYQHIDGILVKDIRCWSADTEAEKEFGLTNILAVLSKGGHDFKHIVIDTVDNAYELCKAYVCAKEGMSHPSDKKYGKGHALVNNEFKRVLVKAQMMGLGILMTSHARVREVETRNGTQETNCPTLTPGATEAVVNMCDLVLYAFHCKGADDEMVRKMTCAPSETIITKDRTSLISGDLPLDWNELQRLMKGKLSK